MSDEDKTEGMESKTIKETVTVTTTVKNNHGDETKTTTVTETVTVIKTKKKFLDILFPESTRCPWIVIICLIVAAALLLFLFEEVPMFGGKILTEAFQDAMDEGPPESSRAFAIFQIILYFTMGCYASSSIYIFAKKHSIEWCIVVIGISIIYLLFCNVYLTLLMKVAHIGKTMYTTYVTSFTAVITILTALAGIKMTHLYKKKEEAKDKGEAEDNKG